jgi:dihydroorotate dehydrogenase
VYKLIIRKILFLFEPETVHNLVIFFLRLPFVSRLMRMVYYYDHPSLRRYFFGLTFRNPVGLAAGMDKDAMIADRLDDLGFGFVEIGTVTPIPQPGNPKPRLFRLLKDEAIINRMGFNNRGVAAAVEKLRKQKGRIIIAGNIGKNKRTPNNEAVSDYEICFQALYPFVDFFVVNVSSPNTPHLRELQEKEPLKKILLRLQELNDGMGGRKPILLKIAPDLNESQLDDIIQIIGETQIDGVVATNTTVGREDLSTPASELEAIGEGGLSGKPLARRSSEIIRYLHQKSQCAFPIIGVGGIHSAEDALEKLEAGASLVEIYTGYVYEGPGLVKKINKALAREAS